MDNKTSGDWAHFTASQSMSDASREEGAKRLLAEPLFQEAIHEVRKDLLSRWETSGSSEVSARESIWLAMRLLDKLHGHIQSIMETGHMNRMLEKQHPFI